MTERAISLLLQLISIPSLSRHESGTAGILIRHLNESGIEAHRVGNNVWARSKNFNPENPTLLLNSHHDTVKPVAGYSFDPFAPVRKDGKIFGLGSNDAGASVVSLTESFVDLYDKELNVNLLLGLTAEEEVCGKGGMELLLNYFRESGITVGMALVGEPTGLNAAIAERGLVVVDAEARGKSGHAAREEGVNAIYIALKDIEKLRNFRFPITSPTLGDVKITVTQIEAGYQHNVVPDKCRFVVDIRTTDSYSNGEVVEILNREVASDLTPRSIRLNASAIDPRHPLVRGAVRLGASAYVSPTLSDRVLMHGIPALKIGPGDSARSHTADEYIYETEIADAIIFYQQLIKSL